MSMVLFPRCTSEAVCHSGGLCFMGFWCLVILFLMVEYCFYMDAVCLMWIFFSIARTCGYLSRFNISFRLVRIIVPALAGVSYPLVWEIF